MRGGLLKGVAALMVLAELIEGPKCGYEINSTISKRLGAALPPGYVYVILRHLEKEGFVVSEASAYKARRKRTYRITEKGLQFLIQHEDKVDRLMSILSYVKSVMELAKAKASALHSYRKDLS
ncbi:MAG: PadR family transcriptional regulator [Acidilobus sp.]